MCKANKHLGNKFISLKVINTDFQNSALYFQEYNVRAFLISKHFVWSCKGKNNLKNTEEKSQKDIVVTASKPSKPLLT